MYSYEDRIRAVELYIRLGKRLKATIRRLGYPTKNALKTWYREYEQRHDLSRQMRRRAPKYSADQKKAAIEHYLRHDRSLVGTIKALGYPCHMKLRAWLAEVEPERRRRVVGKVNTVARPQESKRAAIIDLCTRQEAAQDVAQRVGVSRQSLYKWKDQLLGREAPASVKLPKDLPQAPDRTVLEREIDSLQRNLRRLQLENDLLKKANELLKKDLGIDLRLLGNREKVLLVDALRQSYWLPELLGELNLARSSYFYHRARLRASDKYTDVRRVIADIFELNHRC
jgi:transposase-like protein